MCLMMRLKEAVADIARAKDVATKDYINASIVKLESKVEAVRSEISELKGKLASLQWVLGLLFIMNVAIFVKLFF